MRSMVEGAHLSAAPWLGPLHRRSGGPPPRSGEERRMIGLGHYLAVGAVLFVLGVFGIFLNRKNIIVILMAI
ncbi:MAG: NADH-quinone oxidoreductase subunit, partial [Sphingomonadales bacterium]|nr:NADH-quinone oxidoreductase subunit [Sphingomonadales bacterium]